MININFSSRKFIDNASRKRKGKKSEIMKKIIWDLPVNYREKLHKI